MSVVVFQRQTSWYSQRHLPCVGPSGRQALVFVVLRSVWEVILVGIMVERDHVDTKVGRPVPNWNDWKADAVQLKKINIPGMVCKLEAINLRMWDK